MKVGILTFHRAHNYGAVLQAYALRKTLTDLGADAEIIDYGHVGETKRFDFPLHGIRPFIAALLYNVLSIGNADVRRHRFNKFLKTELGISKSRYNDRNEIKSSERIYDYFITGSDQVWNPHLTNDDYSYLLDFVNDAKKKISYSASFGLEEIPEVYIKDFKKHLKSFKYLSVREYVGRQILKELISREAEVTLDPTFLIDASEWNKIAKPIKVSKPYILCFTIMSDPKGFMEYCRHLQQLTGFEIIRIANPLFKLERGVKTFATAGPREFLGLFKNASIIVTNSFHGTAFSIIFEKPFYTFLYNNERDIRLKEITGRLGLQNRLITGKHGISVNDDLKIDYSKVKQILNYEREFSISYLKKSIIV